MQRARENPLYSKGDTKSKYNLYYSFIKRSKENTGRRIQGPALLQLNYNKNHWTYREQHAQMTAKFITSLHGPPRTRHARMCDECSYKNASSFELEGMDVVLTQSPVPSISAASVNDNISRALVSVSKYDASYMGSHLSHSWQPKLLSFPSRTLIVILCPCLFS